MTLSQTVTIPANRRVRFDFVVPREIPEGQTNVIIQFPVAKKTGTPVVGEFEEASSDEVLAITREVLEKYRPAFEALAK